MTDVGDVNAQTEPTTGQSFEADRVIKVPRRLAVDRHGEQRAEILAAGQGRGRRVRRPRRRLLERRRREVLGNLEMPQGDCHVGPGSDKRPRSSTTRPRARDATAPGDSSRSTST